MGINNRVGALLAKLGDFLTLIVGGDITMKGGAIRSAGGADLRLEPDGSGVVLLGSSVGGVKVTGNLLAEAGTVNLNHAAHLTLGQPSFGWVNWNGNGADGDLITIGNLGVGQVIFELDTNGAVTPGNVPVDISGGVLPGDCSLALETAINAYTASPVVAYDDGNGSVLLCSKTNAAQGLAANGNTTVSGAVMGGVQPAGPRQLLTGRYIVTAADELILTNTGGTILVGTFRTGTNPPNVMVNVLDTNGGAVALTVDTRVQVLQIVPGYYGVFISDDGVGTHELDQDDVVTLIGVT